MTTDTAGRAEARIVREAHGWRIVLGGDWRRGVRLPGVEPLVAEMAGASEAKLPVVVDAAAVRHWDSRFVVRLARLEAALVATGRPVHLEGVPPGALRLLRMAAEGAAAPRAEGPGHRGVLARFGLTVLAALAAGREALAFLGALSCSLGRLATGRARLPTGDFVAFLRRTGADALPVVSLVGVLAGVVLAFVGAAQLARFGAEVYIANLVTLGMAREMGALMAAVIVAGRTGAAFAAELASMKADEEIDALVVLGVDPVDRLVLPRVLALAVAMPLLAVYADAVGILAGAASATLLFDISLVQYREQALAWLDGADFAAGLGKAALYGWLVGFAGCLRGFVAVRSAEGVGRAATSAVVLSVVLIVVGDSLLTIVYYVLGI